MSNNSQKLPTTERVIKNTALVKKWRNIKDTYVKTLKKPKSGSGSNKGRQYLYAKQLSFLQQSSLITETESSLNSEQPVSDEENEELRVVSDIDCDQNNPTSNIQSFNNTSKRKRDLETSLLAFMNSPIPSSTSTTVQSNPNLSFFESLVPILNGFTEEEVIDFRMEVLSIIKRMQKARNSIAQTAMPPNFNLIGYSPQPGTHMTYPHQPPPNFTLTPTPPGQLSSVQATTNIQRHPLPHHTQYPPQLHESYYPLSQPSTSFISSSTNKLIPPQTPYFTENKIQNLPTSQNRHHNAVLIPRYPTQKQPNNQQFSQTPLHQSSLTKHNKTESHVRTPPPQNILQNIESYSVSPPLTSSSSNNEAENGIDDECLNLFVNSK